VNRRKTWSATAVAILSVGPTAGLASCLGHAPAQPGGDSDAAAADGSIDGYASGVKEAESSMDGSLDEREGSALRDSSADSDGGSGQGANAAPTDGGCGNGTVQMCRGLRLVGECSHLWIVHPRLHGALERHPVWARVYRRPMRLRVRAQFRGLRRFRSGLWTNALKHRQLRSVRHDVPDQRGLLRGRRGELRLPFDVRWTDSHAVQRRVYQHASEQRQLRWMRHRVCLCDRAYVRGGSLPSAADGDRSFHHSNRRHRVLWLGRCIDGRRHKRHRRRA
jgi:hypothetical protein